MQDSGVLTPHEFRDGHGSPLLSLPDQVLLANTDIGFRLQILPIDADFETITDRMNGGVVLFWSPIQLDFNEFSYLSNKPLICLASHGVRGKTHLLKVARNRYQKAYPTFRMCADYLCSNGINEPIAFVFSCDGQLDANHSQFIARPFGEAVHLQGDLNMISPPSLYPGAIRITAPKDNIRIVGDIDKYFTRIAY